MDFGKKLQKLLKKILTLISNDPDFKLLTLNQVFVEQSGMTLPGIFCKSN